MYIARTHPFAENTTSKYNMVNILLPILTTIERLNQSGFKRMTFTAGQADWPWGRSMPRIVTAQESPKQVPKPGTIQRYDEKIENNNVY